MGLGTRGWQRWVFGVWAAGEVFLLGGIVHGWPSLVFLLKLLHVNQHLCRHNVTNDGTSTADVNRTVLLPSASDEQIFKNYSDTYNLENLTYMTLQHGQDGETNTVLQTTKESTDKFVNSETTETDIYTGVLPIKAEPPDKSNSEVSSKFKNGGSVWNGTAGNDEAVGGDVTRSCEAQDAAFALSYTIVTAIMASGTVLVGYCQRELGIRTTRLVCGLLLVGGMLMVGFTTPKLPWLVIPGMACVGLAGLALLVTNIQLGALFGRGSTTFVGVLCGCFDVSAIVQLIVKIVVTAGVEFLHAYLGLTVLGCLTFVSTLLWLPKGPTLVVEDDETKRDDEHQGKDASVSDNAREDRKDSHYVTSSRLLSSMTSALFLLHVLWFSLLQLRFFFFLGVLNRSLTQLTDGDLSQVDHYTSVQLYMGIASFVFAVLAGTAYDIQRHRHAGASTREWRLLGPGVMPLSLGSGLCCLMSMLVLAREPRVLYATFLVQAAFRSTMYSLAASFVANTFPPELFGVLYGTLVICGGIFGALQYALFLWSEISLDSIMHVNILLLCTSALTFLHPLHILWKCHRSRRNPHLHSTAEAGHTSAASDSKEFEIKLLDQTHN